MYNVNLHYIFYKHLYSSLFVQHEWNIKAEDIVSLIEGLEANNRVLELEWKCPGRRGPSPVPSNNRQQEHGSQEYK